MHQKRAVRTRGEKKPVAKKAEKVTKLDPKELTERLGPSRKVTKSTPVSKTTVKATLECGHVRIVTPRKSLRCRMCRPEAKVRAAKKVEKKPVAVKKAVAKKPVAVKKPVTAKPKVVKKPVVVAKPEVKREPVVEQQPVAAQAQVQRIMPPTFADRFWKPSGTETGRIRILPPIDQRSWADMNRMREPPDERARVPMISFRNGVKYVDGVEMQITGVRQFLSSNERTIYTSLMWSDGKPSCNCPGWSTCPLFNKKTRQPQDKKCSHSKQVRAGDNILLSTQGTIISPPQPFYSGRIEATPTGRKIVL